MFHLHCRFKIIFLVLFELFDTKDPTPRVRVFQSQKQMVLSDNPPPPKKNNPLTAISVQPRKLAHQAVSSCEALWGNSCSIKNYDLILVDFC
jgi:hypothetical protein